MLIVHIYPLIKYLFKYFAHCKWQRRLSFSYSRVLRILICARYQSLIIYMFYKYFLLIFSWTFYFLKRVFGRAMIFGCNETCFINIFSSIAQINFVPYKTSLLSLILALTLRSMSYFKLSSVCGLK